MQKGNIEEKVIVGVIETLMREKVHKTSQFWIKAKKTEMAGFVKVITDHEVWTLKSRIHLKI